MKILFNTISKSTNYLKHIEFLYSNYDLFRSKHFSSLCLKILQKIYPKSSLFLTHSATGGIEIIASLLELKPEDEIILPSFTFVSTANAFVAKGAKLVFVDINKRDLNIDLDQLEQAITPKTRAVVAVHYVGHSTDMIRLKSICQKHQLLLIEDAAMAFGNQYDGKALGTWGDFGVVSFDITKQISSIQGGLLLINNQQYSKRANYIYHIGTNREEFNKGNVPYYEWVDLGSKYQMNELNALTLYDQLQDWKSILKHRNKISKLYYKRLKELEIKGHFSLIEDRKIAQNYHAFYLILNSEEIRNKLISFLRLNGIESMFHYIPLHNTAMGKKFGNLELKNTEQLSIKLLRLPLHHAIDKDVVKYISSKIRTFFHE